MMIIRALKKVFSNIPYIMIAFLVALLVFVLAVWLPNISLIVKVMKHTGITLTEKLNLPLTLIGSIATNFTLLSAIYTIAIAILFGVNVAMVVYFLRRRIKQVKQSGISTGILGIISGVAGIGCAACGSLVLTSFLSFFGAAGLLAILPLRGGEFGILGIILLAISIHTVAGQIQNPAVCRVSR